jgi:hypothetical protein
MNISLLCCFLVFLLLLLAYRVDAGHDEKVVRNLLKRGFEDLRVGPDRLNQNPSPIAQIGRCQA